MAERKVFREGLLERLLSLFTKEVENTGNGISKHEKFERPYSHSKLGDQQIRMFCIFPGYDSDDIHGAFENVDFPTKFQTMNLRRISGEIRCRKSIQYRLRVVLSMSCIIWTPQYESSRLISSTILAKGISWIRTPLIGRIYHQASGIIVWLGWEGDGSNNVLDVTVKQEADKCAHLTLLRDLQNSIIDPGSIGPGQLKSFA